MCTGKNHTTTKQIKGQERQRRKQQQRQKKRGSLLQGTFLNGGHLGTLENGDTLS